MITIIIYKNGGNILGFNVEGHSGYGAAGSDIVCAAVSSAVQLTVIGICSADNAEVITDEKLAKVSLKLKHEANETVKAFLEAFEDHATALKDEFADYISLKITEV